MKSYLEYDDVVGLPDNIGGGELPVSVDVISRFEQIKTRVRYHGWLNEGNIVHDR